MKREIKLKNEEYNMSKMLITSDLHLGHKRIHKFRPQFETAKEHDEYVFERLASSINKRDTIYFLGDTAFSKEWLDKIGQLRCFHKVLICGNHDLERGLTMRDMVNTYDKVFAFLKKNHFWFSHCPIHPDELRYLHGNIHGHTHNHEIENGRYINVFSSHHVLHTTRSCY